MTIWAQLCYINHINIQYRTSLLNQLHNMWISQRISPLHMWVFYQISCGTSVSLPLEWKPFSWQSNCHASTTAIVCPLLNHAWGEHGSLPYTTMGVTNMHVVESLFNHTGEKTRESSLFYLAGSTNKHLPSTHT